MQRTSLETSQKETCKQKLMWKRQSSDLKHRFSFNRRGMREVPLYKLIRNDNERQKNLKIYLEGLKDSIWTIPDLAKEVKTEVNNKARHSLFERTVTR